MDALRNTIANHKLEPTKTMSLFDGISSISRLPTGTNARYSDAVLKQYSHLWFFFPFDSRFGGNSDVFVTDLTPTPVMTYSKRHHEPASAVLEYYREMALSIFKLFLFHSPSLNIGSIYNALHLQKTGFPRENRTDGTVVVIKTHSCCNRQLYYRVIVLYRKL